ncbi:MAG: glycosyltransferase family 39 protein, partial [Chloroflexota bacterium]|nr:glycosyltransferase family 39 protein [Chloroflexota bacterium]
MTTGPADFRRFDERTLECMLIAALLLLAFSARIVPGQRIVDDAYITFRYARNLVQGRGFVYNPGEPVLGTTTPLYTLLLAAVALVTGSRDFPTIAVIVNALAGAVSVGLLYALGKRVIDHWAPATAAALLWSVASYTVTFAIGGMETDLTIALLLAVSFAHVTARPRWMAALSALALLARPDTAILLGLLWLDRILAQRRLPWREGAIGLGLLAPWLVFGTLTFGSPIPGSIAAKSATYRLAPGESLIRLIQHYSTPFFGHDVLGSRWQLIGFIVYLLLCALGGLRAVRRDRRAWPLLAYPYAYLGVFAAANPLLFRWYLSPPLPFYFLFILAGIWTLAQDLRVLLSSCLDRLASLDIGRLGDWGIDCWSPPLLLSPSVVLLFTALALASTLNAWELHPDHGPDRPAPEMAWFQLELLYTRAADVVLAHAEPGDTLCAGDIGALGYLTDMPILDTVGLVTPEARRYYPANPDIYAINYAIPADLVLALDPDFVVILEVYGRRGLIPDPEFQDRYHLLKKLETDIYGSDGMLIFARAPL